MELFMLLGFVGILRESLKILGKNGMLMAFLTLLILPFYSIFYLSNFFFIKPFITDMLIKESLLPVSDPKKFFSLLIDLKEDLRAFVALEWIFVLISTAASLFFATATIIAAAMVHVGRNLSFKKLLLSTVTSLKRPFFTWFHITLLSFGYIFLVSAIYLSIVLVVQHLVAPEVLAIIVEILASIPHTYLAVFWTLAFVISVLEDESGVEAFGKAGQIVKYMQLHGFLLNLLFTILFIILSHGIDLMEASKQLSAQPIIDGLLLLNFICLVKMVYFVAYTIFHYQCKKTHGEEVELQWNSGYSKVPTLILPNENIP